MPIFAGERVTPAENAIFLQVKKQNTCRKCQFFAGKKAKHLQKMPIFCNGKSKKPAENANFLQGIKQNTRRKCQFFAGEKATYLQKMPIFCR